MNAVSTIPPENKFHHLTLPERELGLQATQTFSSHLLSSPSFPLLVLPEQIHLLTLQPIRHSLIHIIPALVARIRQIIQNGMTETILRHSQILVSLGVFIQFRLGEVRHIAAVDGDDAVLLVEQLDPFGLPLAVLDQAEEDEAAVALDVDGDALHLEALRDGCLHLAYSPLFGQVDVGQRAVLAVHDEVAVGAAFDADFDEFLDGQTAGPGCSGGGLLAREDVGDGTLGVWGETRRTGEDMSALFSEKRAVVLPF